MPDRRFHSPAIRIAILCAFALAIVPRASVYEHRHADGTPGHVHAWDGARLDSVRELIDEARGGHDHPHPHPHPHPHDDGRAAAPTPARRADARKADDHHPGYAAARGAVTRHAHTQAPFQSIARSVVARLQSELLLAPIPSAAIARPRAGTSPALRARSPPLSAQA